MEDMWTPFRELQSIVENSIAKPEECPPDFERMLLNHRQNFLTLLKNPPKNKEHRDVLEKATVSEVDITGMGPVVLPKEIVTEAIILSDMFDLNELIALDLLGTAQTQMANYPDLPRGVIAVLLYYDGRKALVTTLKALVKARKGNLWTVVTSQKMSDFVTSYTDELMRDGILIKIMDLISVLDTAKEIDLLQRNRALGPPKYYQQVVELYESTKQSLAEIVFLWSGQCGLQKEPTFALLNFLRNTKPEEDSSGGLDNVTLLMGLAFLYAIDVSQIYLETGEVIQRQIPLLKPGEEFLNVLQEEMKTNKKTWVSSELQSLVIMGWAVTIATLRTVPQIIPPGAVLDNADIIMKEAIDGKVFSFLNSAVLLNELLYNEVFMLRRIHNLITDFISLMPQKVGEMRLRAEETDKTIHAYLHEGLDPPLNLSHDFKELLICIGILYSKDPLNLQLELDYWCPPESLHLTPFSYKFQSKQMSLYNFLVQTSEVLPSTLFVPYVKMLASLASCQKGARQCFQLLKNNDNKNLTWDHFFSSFNRYFNHLRQEGPTSDTVYRTGPFNKGINSQEIQGLQAVLDLIKSIAENDSLTAETFCQMSSWSAMTVLLGLSVCPIPIPLKTHIFGALSGFASSPNCASALWHAIESAQIIATVPSTSTFQRRGIQAELEEVECRNEEYPLTRSVLRLFSALTDKPIPKLLGASQRTPGFDPYLNFILNSVLLRFHGRPYKNAKEKWEVCELTMALVCKLLLQYDPNNDEFLAKHVQAYSVGTAQVNPPPGYHIMISLCSKSELVRLVLLLLDEGCRILDTYTNFAGKKELENAVFYSLRMLEHGLAIQQQFLSLLNSGNSSLLLPGLNRLILGINPVTSKPDHLLNVAKYVTYDHLLSRHALPAVNILYLITSLSSTPPGHLLSLFTAGELRPGFVGALEADEDEEEVVQMKTSICNFLLQTLSLGAPNVAHYLFGFDLNKEIKKTEFQQPGVRGQPRSCLHSVIGRLNNFLIHPSESSPALVELYYKIIYALAYNTRTSEPVLRFLRSSGDFLRRHLSALPFCDNPTDIELRQMSWLLKTVAIEMKVTGSNQQLSQLASIVEVYTGDQKQTDSDTIDQTFQSSLEKTKVNEQLVLRLIKHLNFDVQPVALPRLEFFDANTIKNLLTENEMEEGRIKLINPKSVHVSLMKHCNITEASDKEVSVAKKKSHLLDEINEILKYVEEYNNSKKVLQATARYFDAWRQATEVMFAFASQDALNLEKRFKLLVDIIHELLSKAVVSSTQSEIAKLASGSILLLCVDLRQTYISDLGKDDESDSKLCNFLDSKYSSIEYKLTTILTNLIKWILSSGVATQKLRANLYAALLNFLQLNREKVSGSTKPTGLSRDSTYVTLLDNTTMEVQRPALGIFMSSFNSIRSYGDRLVDILCHDSSTGHDICKMLALSCLDMVVELDSDISWINVLSSRGYMKFIIHSLLDSDKQLVALLSNNVKSLRALYVYESKMALLCRVASIPSGAEMLLEQNALSCLSTLNVYNKHPEITTNIPLPVMDMDFVPNVSTRYLQILSPALALCDAIISSMGVENQAAIVQVLKFLLCHGEMVTLVLRSGSPFHPLCYLKELAQLTGVIARSTNDEMIKAVGEEGMDPGSVLESTSLFTRIQRLMLSLVSRFVISESLLRDIEKDVDPSGMNPRAKSEVVITFLEIVSHLLLYARNLVSNGGMDRRITNVIFQPALSDSLPDRRDMLTMQEATLGVIVQQLVQAVQYHTREKGNHEAAIRKLETVKNLDSKSLAQYLPQQSNNLNDECERRRQVTKILQQQRDDKQRELEYCYFIIEHCLYIIWAHLDFYMLRGLSTKTLELSKHPKGPQAMDFDISWSVTCDDLNHLKQGLLSVFSDTFSKTLISIVKDMEPKDKGFLEALLRRIKKLIQFVPNY